MTLVSGHTVSILRKMGTGRLSRGQKLMTPLPSSWGQLSQHMSAKQHQASQPTAPEARANSEGPSMPVDAAARGKIEKAEGASRPLDACAKGKADKAEAPSRPVIASVKGKAARAEGPSRPSDTGTSDRVERLPQPFHSDLRASGQPREAPPRPSAGGQADKDDQAHGLANGKDDGQANGQSDGKSKDEKARGAGNGQKRPTWGAPQPPSSAARVAEARTFKVCTHNTTLCCHCATQKLPGDEMTLPCRALTSVACCNCIRP